MSGSRRRNDPQVVAPVSPGDEVARIVVRGDEIDRGTAALVTFIAGGDSDAAAARPLSRRGVLLAPGR